MVKRTSFDQNNKHIHPTRKQIIDTVFNRDSNVKKTHGYTGEDTEHHSIGDVWADRDGNSWEQKDGYKISVSKLDAVRQYLQKLNTCSSSECKTIKYTDVDRKLIRKTGLCLNCLTTLETQLKKDGAYPFYEDYKITRNQLTFVKELRMRFEDAINGVSNKMQFVNENGTLDEWKFDTDIKKVKEDLEKDIEGADEAIQALEERKVALQEKLIELGHPELIK
mgnify:CR=1 FL=1